MAKSDRSSTFMGRVDWLVKNQDLWIREWEGRLELRMKLVRAMRAAGLYSKTTSYVDVALWPEVGEAHKRVLADCAAEFRLLMGKVKAPR